MPSKHKVTKILYFSDLHLILDSGKIRVSIVIGARLPSFSWWYPKMQRQGMKKLLQMLRSKLRTITTSTKWILKTSLCCIQMNFSRKLQYSGWSKPIKFIIFYLHTSESDHSCILQPVSAFEHPSFQNMIHVASQATHGVKIPNWKQTHEEIISLFKAQMNNLEDWLNVGIL